MGSELRLKRVSLSMRFHSKRMTVFADPLAQIFPDEEHSVDELREIIIGHSAGHQLILVNFTSIDDRVRIFSARKAARRERKDYEENVGS
jgi:uncharacterized protein